MRTLMYAHRHSFVEPTILKFSILFWYLVDKKFEKLLYNSLEILDCENSKKE
ncbi:hypothetical protein BTBSAS_70106 [Brochothrix thermosphacta]|uniref:Uncharacterized protein n=1 Tax=Brochothrix thermosphacta TaxID=2756 RepID=A0A2X0QND1_BROTH|nr:hypothetical protein BTBSAS_70106 [Brochothrix thermosphacta]